VAPSGVVSLTAVSCAVSASCVAVGTSSQGGGIVIGEVVPPPTTAVLLPSNAATVSGGSLVLDASATSPIGLSSVTFELTGGTLSAKVVATATPTLYGWLALWNTTSVPNGSYSLQSVATDADADTVTSASIAITVDNPPPSTSVLIPSDGATQSGGAALLDASASANVNEVTFELTGGALSNQVIATATPTIYGWLAQWNTTSVSNGNYNLQSVASYPNGVSTTSSPISVTVNNPSPSTTVLIPSDGATQSGGAALLDASASANVNKVSFELTGGPDNDTVIASGFPTVYGWLAQWITTSVPNGIYTLQSVASYVSGMSGSSAPITITVQN
jgi:hypothetical protein